MLEEDGWLRREWVGRRMRIEVVAKLILMPVYGFCSAINGLDDLAVKASTKTSANSSTISLALVRDWYNLNSLAHPEDPLPDTLIV